MYALGITDERVYAMYCKAIKEAEEMYADIADRRAFNDKVSAYVVEKVVHR